MSVGERLKDIRKKQRITLKVLAMKCGLSISFLSDIEHGRRNPSLEKLSIIAKGLNTTVSCLLDEEPSGTEDTRNYLIYRGEQSLEFREVLQKIEEFDNWSHEDREELLTYLTIKEKIRRSKNKKNTSNSEDR